ncbi:hypothetical protein B0H14DRAFT_3771464 [Mycena olivaceomarginata]|nr:hypothetical protein B0H14DRAFT_3442719 [Mycena olivaceomarginata]KAJ7879737.1 hypothetical protein B0H14DRAFT_3771464 [Mycena olivaceomarginata]
MYFPFSTDGTPVTIQVNSFAMSVPNSIIHHYDVVISPSEKTLEKPSARNNPLDCITAQRRLLCSLYAARDNTQLSFRAPPLPSGVELPLFVHLTVETIPAEDEKLKLTKKEREKAESTLTDFGETVRRAERKKRAHQNRPRSPFFPSSIIRALPDSLLPLDSQYFMDGSNQYNYDRTFYKPA